MTLRLPDDTHPSVRHRVLRQQARFDLSLSENPFPPLPSVLIAVNKALAQANRYPEFLPRRLPRLIAGRVGVGEDQVVVGSGATGVAFQIMQALTAPGAGIVYGAPTFDGYPIMAEMAGLAAVPVPLDAFGDQDVPAMARAIDGRAGLAIVCRPHNPTGTVLSANEIGAFLGAVPSHVPVVLDEAYAEFLAPADRIDTLRLLDRYPNLLVLRTFSKAYGLAGLRIGYCFGAREPIERIRRLQLPFGVSAAAMAAVDASYAAETELRARIARITAEREALRDALCLRGLAIPRSHANFLYLPGPGVATALRRAGITAKAYPDGSARVTVGDPAADRAVLVALESLPR
ncbi:aminotransferase class I/II-fold pyridoxal phosphate-dependent enzyme [Nocardia panacis]|uniref:Aminotransferase class I/II-fold pyridoxal phosphate-dependent enzyme n=1 Tax=Nocardia panacis TaxID=2340916 RepID=A0A3A4KMR0_9NOCA|nr:aminotransferase class I/II-fold pyridoxal phosphate-dependent enzyme [Nocardia panacis]RJO76848.1 aminotransferase class I/II-fold pyridoxal phosphate-dependent enzyme [Nocardia panacis]